VRVFSFTFSYSPALPGAVVAFSGLSLFTFPLEYAGNISPAVRRCQQARDKQIDWFMNYLKLETKDASFADKKNPR